MVLPLERQRRLLRKQVPCFRDTAVTGVDKPRHDEGLSLCATFDQPPINEKLVYAALRHNQAICSLALTPSAESAVWTM